MTLWRLVAKVSLNSRIHTFTAVGAASLAACTLLMEDVVDPEFFLRPQRTIARCDEAVDAARKLCEPPPPPPAISDPEENAKILERWRSHISDARTMWSKLDVAGAEAELRTAVEIAAHFGKNSAPMATSFVNLAQLLHRCGRYAEAEPLLLHASSVLEENAGPNNKVTLLALIDLASVQLALGKVGEAATGSHAGAT